MGWAWLNPLFYTQSQEGICVSSMSDTEWAPESANYWNNDRTICSLYAQWIERNFLLATTSSGNSCLRNAPNQVNPQSSPLKHHRPTNHVETVIMWNNSPTGASLGVHGCFSNVGMDKEAFWKHQLPDAHSVSDVEETQVPSWLCSIRRSISPALRRGIRTCSVLFIHFLPWTMCYGMHVCEFLRDN